MRWCIGVALAVFLALATAAHAGLTRQSIHADMDGRLKMWKTINGDIVGQWMFNERVLKCYKRHWNEYEDDETGKTTDREYEFLPDEHQRSVQKEAFFDGGTMAYWIDFWDAQTDPYYYEWPVLLDAADQSEVYVGIDLTAWMSSPVPFSFGDIIPVVDGRNDALLPGYLVSTDPLQYVAGTGWVASTTLTGDVVVGAKRDGETVPEPGGLGVLSVGVLVVLLRRRE